MKVGCLNCGDDRVDPAGLCMTCGRPLTNARLSQDDARQRRRDERLADILNFSGAETDSLVVSMLKLAYESGYLHGSRDAHDRALAILKERK